MLKQRLLITFTLGPLGLFLIYLGGWFFFVPFATLLALATVEYVQLLGYMRIRLLIWLLLPLTAVQWLMAQLQLTEWEGVSLLVSLLLIVFFTLLAYERHSSDNVTLDWVAMMGGFVLLGWLGSHFFRLRGMDISYAWQWTMLAMVATWAADGYAYLVGKFMAGRFILGRHQFSPRLSPNKTVEGYVGGIVLGGAMTVLFGYFLQVPLTPVIVLSFTLPILAPLGDLSISLIKREAGVKDSGKLLPGHGGALDRVDTLLWTLPIAYYLAILLAL
jgi:phosphatidate cytidylyltransferase